MKRQEKKTAVLSLPDLDESIKAAVENAAATGEPVFIKNKDGVDAVLISSDVFDNLLGEIEHLSFLINPNVDASNIERSIEGVVSHIKKIGSQFKDLQNAYVKLLLTLASNMDQHESYVTGHCERLAILSSDTARQMGLSEDDIDNVKMAALLHDIGEVFIPGYILQKTARLTSEEWDIIKQHPRIGADFVNVVRKLEQVAAIIYSHHEKFDGSGYPAGLKGEQIPVGARIISVVDAYDAMTNLRLHREPGTHQEAVDELMVCCGTVFDPQVVNAFITLF